MAEEPLELCDLNVGLIPNALLEKFFAGMTTAKPICRREGCKFPLAEHHFSISPPATPPQAGGPAGLKAPMAKEVQRAADCAEIIERFQSSYRFDPTAAGGLLDLDLLIRSADCANLGYVGATTIGAPPLPPQTPKAALLMPWTRAERMADTLVIIATKYKYVAHRLGDGIQQMRRDTIFEKGEGTISRTDAGNLESICMTMSIGLRGMAARDRAQFGRCYANAEARLMYATLGPANWFIRSRNATFDKLRSWIRSLRTRAIVRPYDAGRPLEGGAAGGAAGAVAQSEFARAAEDWPFYGLGAAMVTAGGREDDPETTRAWSAFEAAESVLAHAVATQTGAKAISISSKRTSEREAEREHQETDRRNGGNGGNGGAGTKKRRQGGKKDSTPEKERDAGRDLWKTQSPEALKAARAEVAKKKLDEITRADCQRASLCFRCKKEFHGGRNLTCEVRGSVIAGGARGAAGGGDGTP